ncbi:MAG: TlpA family protein disulfide reductase [Verrucomicrobia bacterium]|nr:TlpA family protein disulfide reductase [Verrucomicrobiota bacterium]
MLFALRAGAESVPAAAPVAPPAVAPSVVQTELRQLVGKIKAKLQSGARNEEALTEELKGFDAIIAAHKGEQAEDLAQVLFMKAMLYIEVLKDLDKGENLLKQLKQDYPKTQLAQKVDGLLPVIAQQRETQKIQAAFAPGAQFPDFDEKDIEGKPLSIAKFKGKIVLVDFWATWCGPCVAELPNVLEAYKKYHDKGFEIIGISLDKEEAKFKAFIAEKGMTWSHYFDGLGWSSKLGKKYGIESIPATFLLDRDGKVIAKGLRGPALLAELEKQLGK